MSGTIELPRQKYIVLIWNRSTGPIQLSTYLAPEAVKEILLPGRDVVYLEGVDDAGSKVDHWLDLKATAETWDIAGLAVKPDVGGKVMTLPPGVVMRPH